MKSQPAVVGPLPRASRKTIRLSYGRRYQHLHAQVEVARHALDNQNLLRILLPENSCVRPARRKELGNDCRHTSEMARSRGAAEPIRQPGYVHVGHKTVRIHLLDRGRKDHVAACRLDQADISIKVTRVGRIIFVRPKLCGIDKKADNHDIPVPACAPDQAAVARVEVSHRRDKSHPPAGAACCV